LIDPAQADALMNEAVRLLGKLDILINCAGIYPAAPIAELTHDMWRATLLANADAVFNCTRAAIPFLSAGGAVVNIASIAAINPAPGHAHYSSAKAAIVAYTRACAQELGPRGIRVNAVSPGLIDRPDLRGQWPEGVRRWQDKAPLGRLGTAEDVANACLFLVSSAAGWISGHNLVVDGGMLSAPIY
jgi:3-oxoacyl-[acyl-carrier protein] reductase